MSANGLTIYLSAVLFLHGSNDRHFGFGCTVQHPQDQQRIGTGTAFDIIFWWMRFSAIIIPIRTMFYREPQQGDIVVCSKESFDDGTCFVKRVIATEGQEVFIDFEQSKVYVDGVLLDEPYVHSPTTRKEGIEFPLIVGEGQIFVLGDNRDRSTDSRSPMIGLVDERQIVGKAIFILTPGNNDGKETANWNRIGWINS